MLLPLLLLLAAGRAVPEPGPIRAFGDWEVACDNVRRCEMVSLTPEGDRYADTPDLSIVREPGPTGDFTLTFGADHIDGEARLAIDGKMVGGGRTSRNELTLRGDAAKTVIAAIAMGQRITLIDSAGAEVGHALLDGSAAALRFIDAEQGRAGTVTAIMATGDKPASAVPATLPLPHVVAIRPDGSAAKVTPALIRTMIALSKCTREDIATGDPITGHAIGGGATLVLLPCGANRWAVTVVPFVVIAGKPVLAQFDAATDGDGKIPMLVSGGWDEKTRLLGSYDKGRASADCGRSADYAWDGHSFHLVDQTRMDACRGWSDWLTVWRATVDSL